MHEIQAVVSGQVQAVAYRVYAQDAATELGLTGYVKNLPDGTVFVCAQGERDTLKDFIEHLHEGSLKAKVESVSVEWGTPETVFDDFGIVH
ncbi:acylphosphatase [bacterium]|nr:acylphosphatase [bacterium]|tara:strand:+ start:456 stop:728 length:273 start_codon:yes stop_codon:yes gene_type:complete